VAKEEEKEKEEEKKSGEEGAAEGAEGGEGGDALESGGKKRPSPKMLMIIGGGILALLLGGGSAAFFLTRSHAPAGEEGASATESKASSKEEKESKAGAAFFSLGDILVNLNGDAKRPNFLKIKVSLELTDPKDLPLMEAIKPRIVDNFQVYLRELRVEDLRGSAGLYRLREELLLRVTEAAQPVRVRDVLFQEMLVQ